MSKVPQFPFSSIADGILPSSPPAGGENFNVVKLIPQQGMMGNAIAVYLAKDDMTSPTYFFMPTGGSCKLFRCISGPDGQPDRQEVVQIKSGWQSSKGHGSTNFSHNENQPDNYVTTSAKKNLMVVGNNGQSSIKIKKTYERKKGEMVVEIESGYEIKEDPSSNLCDIVSRDGRIIAYVYDKTKNMNPAAMMNRSGPLGMIQYMKAPVALYIDHLSEVDLEITLAIIATAGDRLIRTASLNIHMDIHSGGPGRYPSGNNQHNEDDLFGNGGGDYGGGDYGGGGDDGGGGGGYDGGGGGGDDGGGGGGGGE